MHLSISPSYPRLTNYDAVSEQRLSLAGPRINRVFDLVPEPDELRSRYGGQFGQMIARIGCP